MRGGKIFLYELFVKEDRKKTLWNAHCSNDALKAIFRMSYMQASFLFLSVWNKLEMMMLGQTFQVLPVGRDRMEERKLVMVLSPGKILISNGNQFFFCYNNFSSIISLLNPPKEPRVMMLYYLAWLWSLPESTFSWNLLMFYTTWDFLSWTGGGGPVVVVLIRCHNEYLFFELFPWQSEL